MEGIQRKAVRLALALLAAAATVVALLNAAAGGQAAENGEITFSYAFEAKLPLLDREGQAQYQFLPDRIELAPDRAAFDTGQWGCILACSSLVVEPGRATFGQQPEVGYSKGQWAPDGSKLAFVKTNYHNQFSQESQVHLLDDRTGATTQLTFDDLKTDDAQEQYGGASFSPDGKYLAVAGVGGGISIFSADGSSSTGVSGLNQPRTTAGGRSVAVSASWHPSDSQLAVVWRTDNGGSETFDLYTYRLHLDVGKSALSAGVSGERRLTNGAKVGSPQWSPDGSQIVFDAPSDVEDNPEFRSLRGIATRGDLYTIDPQGPVNSQRLFAHGGFEPHFSPDGRQVLFAGARSDARIAIVRGLLDVEARYGARGRELYRNDLFSRLDRDLYVKNLSAPTGAAATRLTKFNGSSERGDIRGATATAPAWRPLVDPAQLRAKSCNSARRKYLKKAYSKTARKVRRTKKRLKRLSKRVSSSKRRALKAKVKQYRKKLKSDRKALKKC